MKVMIYYELDVDGNYLMKREEMNINQIGIYMAEIAGSISAAMILKKSVKIIITAERMSDLDNESDIK